MILSLVNILDLIILLGAIQGIIFASILIFKPLRNKKASRFLGLFLLAFAGNSIYFTLETLGLRNGLNVLSLSPLYCSLWIVTGFYFFIQFLLNPDYKFSFKDYISFLPAIFQTGFQILGLGLYFLNRQDLYKNQNLFYSVYNLIDILLLVIGVLAFVLVLIQLKTYEKRLLNNYAEIEDFSLAWVYKLVLSLVVLLVLFAIPNLYELISAHSPPSIYYPMWISFSFLIYWMGYSVYFKNPSENKIELSDKITKTDKSKLSLNTEAYHQSLLKLMDDEQPYLDQDLNLKKLANQLDISSGYLSQIINQYQQKNFLILSIHIELKQLNRKWQIQNPTS